jgi:hypothetical protein
LFGIYAAGVGVAAFFSTMAKPNLPVEMLSWTKMEWKLSFGNVMNLRAQLASTLGFLLYTWAVPIEQFFPHVLMVLFITWDRPRMRPARPFSVRAAVIPNGPFRYVRIPPS